MVSWSLRPGNHQDTITCQNGTIYSLLYRAEGRPIVIEACQLINGTSLPKSRQWLTKMAERWGVPFVDQTIVSRNST